ncbi:hypothetical protein NE237_002139 [Protea cynaroides]|uniref:Uncharacterized protein n=1 Tax=Protea cynaroides TaxID=273540 RepID=A0A9Q0KUF7_9MAGN|nr:hypothetical protein NE237_002139 [Protea cynaroides]
MAISPSTTLSSSLSPSSMSSISPPISYPVLASSPSLGPVDSFVGPKPTVTFIPSYSQFVDLPSILLVQSAAKCARLFFDIDAEVENYSSYFFIARSRGGWGLSAPWVALFLLSWNCQGLWSSLKICALGNILEFHHPNILFLMKIKNQSSKVEQLKRRFQLARFWLTLKVYQGVWLYCGWKGYTFSFWSQIAIF